jgi:MoaA/NifB/PqqE/SkfB family radical SAM enzyme
LGGGEPTVLPDFPELLAAIRAGGMVPNVTTNGTIHRPEVVAALAEHAGVVHLSADQPDRLDAARGPGVFARLRRTARDLAEAGVRLGVNLLLTPDTARDLPRSLESALPWGRGISHCCGPRGIGPGPTGRAFPRPRPSGPSPRASARSWRVARPCGCTSIRRCAASGPALGLFEDPEPEVAGCGGGQRHVAITPEGNVFPSSHARRARYRMGNLLTDEPDRIWSRGPGRLARQQYVKACRGVRCACQLKAQPLATDSSPPVTVRRSW